MTAYDAIIVGAGPAGSTAASCLAEHGWKTLLLERDHFPRHKVCGDCLNPSAWPVIEDLGLADEIINLPHAEPREVVFESESLDSITVPLRPGRRPKLVIGRSVLDELLATRATRLGAEFLQGCAVTGIERSREMWTVETSSGSFRSPVLLAADGRNSRIASLAGRLGKPDLTRISLQNHVDRTSACDGRITLFFHRHGYGGIAPISADQMNVCVVSSTSAIQQTRDLIAQRFPVSTPWRSVTPLARTDSTPIAADGLFLVGDAARVVEPFTGEGITYALLSGWEAASHLATSPTLEAAAAAYGSSHRRLFSGRLWINQFARTAAANPSLAAKILRVSRIAPFLLAGLTNRLWGDPGSPTPRAARINCSPS